MLASASPLLVTASEKIKRRILDVDGQIERARVDRKEVRLNELVAVRKAYLVDLMDVLNEEEVLRKRRGTDDPKLFGIADVEKWIHQ